MLKDRDIKYIPTKTDYIVFAKGFKRYEKEGATINEVMNLLRVWFQEDIGAWCGYKLSNFWGDIGKIQLKANFKHTDLELQQMTLQPSTIRWESGCD